jgi:hypothetical protein
MLPWFRLNRGKVHCIPPRTDENPPVRLNPATTSKSWDARERCRVAEASAACFASRASFISVRAPRAAAGSAVGGAVAYDASHSARAWGVIVVSVVLQQALAWARTAVRVGQLAAQATYCEGWLPLPATAPGVMETEVAQNGPAAAAASPQAGTPSEIVVDHATREG